MKLKVYERTGIKEENALKDNQARLIKRQILQQAIKHSIERGIYKENCKNSYDLNLMDYKKEYKKTEDLLKLYQDMAVVYEENICILIEGYVEYFNTYGSNMNALGLRGFRKNIERVVKLACSAEKIKRKESQIENAVIEFVIEHYDDIEYFDEEIDDSDIMCLMYELGLNRKNQHEYEDIKSKVKTIYEELKDDKRQRKLKY